MILFGNSQIAFAFLVVDSHRAFCDNRLIKQETVEGVFEGNVQIELRRESCAYFVVDSHQ